MQGTRVPRLSLDLLRSFRAAARHLSFTRAAQELFLTQPAISRGIRTLEEQLGTPLFTRVNRTLRLTSAGEALYRAADDALRTVDDAAQRIAGASRTIAVTVTVPMASLWLGPRLAAFTGAHPDVGLRVAASNDVLDLQREGVDVAIRHVRDDVAPPSDDRLLDYEVFPVCAPALAGDSQRPLARPDDLSRHVLLDMETLSNGRRWCDWQHWFDAMGLRPVKPLRTLRFSHYDQVVQAAIAGAGVAIGKRPHLTRQLRDGALVAPMGPAGCAPLGAFYVVVSAHAQDEVVQPFVRWLHEQAALDAALDAAPARVRARRAAVGQRS